MEKEKKLKQEKYARLHKQLEELMPKSNDDIARMATISALLYHKMPDFFWCGFYRMINGELTVGPYQGPLACLVLKKDTGVCWAGINEEKPIVVPDVEKFPGHISCDSRSKSEIVVPVRDRNGKVIAVLDVDSKEPDTFDEIDRECLEKIVALMNE